jgi:hypothetical protein
MRLSLALLLGLVTWTTSASAKGLTGEEREILERGEISTTSHVAGGVAGTVIGLGIGHAIQGRYWSRGLIFTVGEPVLAGLFVVAASESSTHPSHGASDKSYALVLATGLALLGLRAWQINDIWTTPPEHNRRYQLLKARQKGVDVSPFAAPTEQGSFAYGIQIRF